MENSNDTTCNRARDLPACSAVPQSTEPPRIPLLTCGALFYSHRIYPIMQFSFNSLLYVNNKGGFTEQKCLLLQKQYLPLKNATLKDYRQARINRKEGR
jgi:hypothetical protein